MDLSHNKITIISKEFFKGMYLLHQLDLSNNPIHFIEETAFAKIVRHTCVIICKFGISLDLSNTNFSTFGWNIFKENNLFGFKNETTVKLKKYMI